MTHDRGLRRLMSWNRLALAVVLTVLGLLGTIADCPAEEPKVRLVPQRHANEKLKTDYNQLIAPHLEKAKKETDEAIEKALSEIAGLFEGAKNGTRAFAESALGLRSKWWYFYDRLPFTSGTSHREFLEEKFREKVLNGKEFAKSLTSILKQLGKEVYDIESRMLIALRADLPDLPPNHPPKQWDNAQFEKEFRTAIDSAEEKAKDEMSVAVGREVCVGVVSEVCTLVARRLLASAGIVSMGGTFAPETLGLSLAIGFIVDQIISWVWDGLFDPAGGLAMELNHKLDSTRDRLIKGTDKEPGLRSALKQMSEHRNKLRRDAILQVLKDNR